MDTKVAQALTELLTVANNGPEEVGLAAASTDRGDPVLALTVAHAPVKYDPDAKVTSVPPATVEEVHRCILYGPVCPVNEPEAKLLWIAAQVYCIVHRAYGIYKEAGTNVATEPDEKTHANDPNKLVGISNTTHSHLVRALTLVAVGKVCWWMANHHTGQGELLRYMQKAIKLTFQLKTNAEVTREHVTFAHAIGHWFSTGAVLGSLGIEGISDCHAVADTFGFTCTRDMRLRLNSGPAGTGATSSYAAIVKKAMKSAFSVFLPPSTGYAEALAFVDRHQHVDVKYHVGRGFLEHSNRACDTGHDLDEDVKISLSAFVHAIMPGSTLAGSKSILAKEEVSGTDLYSKLVNAKMALSVNTNDQEAAMLVQAMSGAYASADPFAAVRRSFGLDDRDVTAALAAVKARLSERKG
jgi:hypothetical protein